MTLLQVSFSRDTEFEQVRGTCQNLPWVRTQGYRCTLPNNIDGQSTDQEIMRSLSEEFSPSDYTTVQLLLESVFDSFGRRLLEGLSVLGGTRVEPRYFVTLTKYGTGGSYDYPNGITINITLRKQSGVVVTVIHEIVHLAIEQLIQQYQIEHWTKERVVDLIVARIFPEYASSQRDPINALAIDHVFRLHYPHIDYILASLSAP